jgi:hypothetical protein
MGGGLGEISFASSATAATIVQDLARSSARVAKVGNLPSWRLPGH